MPAFTSILTYHSQNIGFPEPHSNDHVALAEDLEAIHTQGYQVKPLSRLIEFFNKGRSFSELEKSVFITFDDGCDMDFMDCNYPESGLQTGFYGILQNFIRAHGRQAQPELHTSSFVIASPEARKNIDRAALLGKGWISDHWWRSATQSGLLSIENHSWDHFHGYFQADEEEEFIANNEAECELQVIRSNQFIARRSGRHPRFYAYPFGHTGDLLPEQYFPKRQGRHQLWGALSTEPSHVHQDSNPWLLPRWVCGRDWENPDELLKLLAGND